MTILTILTGTMIAQGIYAGILLLIGNKNLLANKFLGVLVCLSSLWLIDTYLRITNGYLSNPDLYFMPIFYSLGFGPLVYFYTEAITDRDFTFTRRHFYHFIPVVIQCAFYITLFWSSYSFKRWFWFEIHRPITYDLEFNLTLLSLFGYSFFSIKRIQIYQKWIKNQFSEISKIHLNWLKILQYLLIIICAFWLMETILREIFLIYAQKPISAFSLSLSILLIATGGVLQPNLFFYRIEKINESLDNDSDKTIDSSILTLIQEEMKSNKYFLDSDLTLKIFSAHLKIPPRRISIHINQGLNMTFIDFVNTYRIDLVKQRIQLKEFDHLTLNGIALESGFNSKSTFNRVFKSMTGQTPSQYKKTTQYTG